MATADQVASNVYPTSGYINGSDLLMAVDGKATGHSTEHTVTYDTETKDRAVKAPEVQGISSSFFKETTVTGLSITISFKGLQNYGETELAAGTLKDLWAKGKPVTVECFRRPTAGVQSATARTPYLKAQFIITKLSEGAPVDEDATYDGELKMTGAPEIWTPATNG